jgi:cytosine/adenosine deaminase-related metal-dependent hydrolase
VLYDMDRPEWTPRFNPLFNLVHTAEAAPVDTVVCDGRILMEGGRVLTIDEGALLAESEKVGRRIVARAGLTHLVKPKWPIV